MSEGAKSSTIVPGEASESDNEEYLEQNVKPANNPIKKNVVHGAVISGEASESEDEGASVSSAVSAAVHMSQPIMNIIQNKPKQTEKYDSLLHKKLRERNISLHTTLCEYVNNVITTAGKELNATDQQLLRSQITLQAAISVLHSLQQNVELLKNKLNDTVNSNFLPDIVIPNQSK